MLLGLNLDKKRRSPKSQIEFLKQPGNMFGICLGACLDSCRWGSTDSVMWNMTYIEMIDFIQNWMQQNNDNFPRLFGDHEWEKHFGTIIKQQKLPFINYECCPIEKTHSTTILDCAGRLRCGHKTIRRYKPSFFHQYYTHYDGINQHTRTCFCESKPDELPADAWNEKGELDELYEKAWEEYNQQLYEYESEDRTAEVLDVCYALIKENPMRPLSLLTILERCATHPITYLKYYDYGEDPRCDCNQQGYMICMGHKLPTRQMVFPFDGWALAFYIQEWYKQFQLNKPLLW